MKYVTAVIVYRMCMHERYDIVAERSKALYLGSSLHWLGISTHQFHTIAVSFPILPTLSCTQCIVYLSTVPKKETDPIIRKF